MTYLCSIARVLHLDAMKVTQRHESTFVQSNEKSTNILSLLLRKMNIFQIIQKACGSVDCSRNQRQAVNHQLNPDQDENGAEIEMFQTVRKKFAAIGFTPNQRQNNCWQFTVDQVIGVGKLFMDAVLTGIYLYREANHIIEYIDCGFLLTLVVGATIVYINFVVKNNKMFNMLELIATEQNFSKWSNVRFPQVSVAKLLVFLGANKNPAIRVKLEKTNRIVEELCEIFYFAAINVGVPCSVLPKVIMSYFIYITTDAGNAAFELPFPGA